jgi:hypothetical protein
MATLVVDTGQDIVGIFSVQSQCFAFYRGHLLCFVSTRTGGPHAGHPLPWAFGFR